MPAKREISIHVRLSDEADAVLELLAEARAQNKAQLAAELLHKALLGEGHSLRVAAQRLARAGLLGMKGERGRGDD